MSFELINVVGYMAIKVLYALLRQRGYVFTRRLYVRLSVCLLLYMLLN